MGTFVNPFQAPSKYYGPVNGATGWLGFVPFDATTAATVGNTITETSLIGTGVGTKTIPANYFSVGSMVKIYLTGSIGTDAVVPSITIKVYHGATVLSTATVTPGAQIAAGTFFEYTSTIMVPTIGAGGNLVTGQVMWLNNATAVGPAAAPASQAVNTTVAGALDVKITWGTAAALNTITVSTAYIEVIG